MTYVSCFSVLSLPCPGLEKSQAFAGLLSVLHANQDLVLSSKSNVYSLLVACVSWAEADAPLPPQLQSGFKEVFVAIRNHNAEIWTRVITTFEKNGYSLQALIQLYQLQ